MFPLLFLIVLTPAEQDASFIIAGVPADILGSDSSIDCPSRSACFVQCAIDASCSGSIINCPEDGECSIFCEKTESCSDITIHGGARSKIIVECNGENSCKNAEFDGFDAATFVLKGCEASGSCIGVTLRCPQNMDGIPQCTVIGNDQFGGTLRHPLTLYAVNGFLDINLSGISSPHRVGTMYCGTNLSSSCRIDGNDKFESSTSKEWRCNPDGSALCSS